MNTPRRRPASSSPSSAISRADKRQPGGGGEAGACRV